MNARDVAARHERKDIAQFLMAYEDQKRCELASKPAVPVVDLNAVKP